MRSVLFNFNFELMLLFTGYFKIVLDRFRSSLLHYRYMYTGGILTVVRARPETQLDCSVPGVLGLSSVCLKSIPSPKSFGLC
jgi:hypothetical protein